ncbi:hypothetical protein PoMZ_03212 [Pyricularia oryzae]|uniref:Uncharacterized protein n=1 Tax=Pyricularia oryzae TaxID=318829 RepID=A0A4P7N6M5_PYROR|nr:hypothetical protein PoMZ_03212 [Pyricularia oryzae]
MAESSVSAGWDSTAAATPATMPDANSTPVACACVNVAFFSGPIVRPSSLAMRANPVVSPVAYPRCDTSLIRVASSGHSKMSAKNSAVALAPR